MSTPVDAERLPGRWKALILSLLVLQGVTLWALFNLADYAVWLHFDGRDTKLTDTRPGGEAALVVGITLALLFIINVRNFAKAVQPATPEERARRSGEGGRGEGAGGRGEGDDSEEPRDQA